MATPLKGDGLLLVFSDVAPQYDEEYNYWYNHEHIPERLGIPGVLNVARYQAVQGGPRYLACYELDSSETWYTDAWQRWLQAPTIWSLRMQSRDIRSEHIHSLYDRVHPAELSDETRHAGMSPVLLVGRMTVPEELEEQFNEAYNNERLPLCADIPGYVRARRFHSVSGPPHYATIHEMMSLEVPQSEAWENWRTAETPVWTNTVRPKMVHAPGSPGVYARIFPR